MEVDVKMVIVVMGIFGVACKVIAAIGVGAVVGIGGMVALDQLETWRKGREVKKKSGIGGGLAYAR